MVKLLFLLNVFLFRQDNYFFVSNVKGKIFYAKTKAAVLVGDQLKLNEELIFNNETDEVDVISPSKGKFIIRKTRPLAHTKLSGIILTISDNIAPAVIPQTLAGRGIINNTDDLRQFLQFLAVAQHDTAANLAVIDTLRITLSRLSFGQTTAKFFFLRYVYRNHVINKKLNFMKPVDEKNLILVLDNNIKYIDQQQIDPAGIVDPALYYYDSAEKISVRIAPV
jgi:hypothetical protein